MIARHSAVRDVATFAVPHPSLGEDVACAVVLATDRTASPEELRTFARKQLASFKVPRYIFLREKIPRGATGKPKRLQLREEYTTAHEVRELSLTRTEAFAVTEERRQIVTIWASFLGTKNVSDNDDFFALGGDSLSATSMLVAVEANFNLKLPLSTEAFINNPTIIGITRMLADAGEVESLGENLGIAYPMRKEGRLGAIFLVPADETTGLYLRRLVRHASGDWASYLVHPQELAPYRTFVFHRGCRSACGEGRDTRTARRSLLRRWILSGWTCCFRGVPHSGKRRFSRVAGALRHAIPWGRQCCPPVADV